MKIIIEPNVHVLAVPVFFPHPEYAVPDDNSSQKAREEDQVSDNFYTHYPQEDIHSLIAHAGKGCYDSYGKDGRSIEAHIQSLITTRHGSVFEHACISLFITGISRGLSHEFVRHRHFAYSQRSTRYTNEDGAAIVLDPFYTENYKACEGKVENSVLLRTFLDSCARSLYDYKQAVDTLLKTEECKAIEGVTNRRKWARGKARQLLPHALETRMTVTGNLRAWRWFIEERSGPGAEPEIRRLAMHVFNAIQPLAPLVFADYEIVYWDGLPHYTTNFRKI